LKKALFPTASENGFLYEFAAKKAFFDILFSKISSYYAERGVNTKSIEITEKHFPFLNFKEIVGKCFFKNVDKVLSSAKENGCPKAVMDYNIKTFFSAVPFFIYEFLFEIYYKESVIFFNRLFNHHNIGIGGKNAVEIYFDSGSFINVDSLGITNDINFFSYVKLLQESEKIFRNKIIREEYGRFLFKKREALVGGEWFKSDFLLKITDINTSGVKYINIDFGQFYSDVKFLKNLIFSVFEESEKFYNFIDKLDKKGKRNFKRKLSFFYDLHKTSFIVSEMQKTGDFAFLETDNVNRSYEEKDVFKRAVKNKSNERFLSSIITLGKPMLKIIQSGAYVDSVLRESEKKKETYIFLKDNEKFSGAFLYSMGSIYQKHYFIRENGDEKIKEREILSLMSKMYVQYVKMRKENYFWNLFSLFKFNPYFKAIKIEGEESEEKKRDVFYYKHRLFVKNMTETEEPSKISLKGSMFINKDEFYGLNSEIRMKHYRVFKNFLKKNNPLIINCASPGTGKTTSVFKYCFEEQKDFYYFSSRIQIMQSIYKDIKKGYESFLSKYTKEELNEGIQDTIKNVFKNIVFLTLNGNDIGLKVEKDGKEREAVRVRYYAGEDVDEENLRKIIENTPIDEDFVFIAEKMDEKKDVKFFKREYSEGITEKRKKGTRRDKLRESGVAKALRNLYKKTIPEIRKTKSLVVTAFTLQALEKSGINGKDILKNIISNGKSVTMFDEVFGSSEPKKLLKKIILDPDVVSELNGQKRNGSVFVLADANIKHEEMVNFVLKEYNSSSLNNKLVFFKNEGAKDIEVKYTKINSLKVPVILTNSFPARNVYINFVSEFLPRGNGNVGSINVFLKHIGEEYKKVKGSDEMVFVYIQNKDLINNIKKSLIEKCKIPSEEIIEYHSDIEYKKEPDKKTKIILATSTASRGLTFTKVRRFVILFQNFNIVSGLGELSQVIYRGRGRGNDDDTDKHFTFIYQDYYTQTDSFQNAEYVSAFKFYSMLTKFFITVSVFSLFSGYKMRPEDMKKNDFIRNGILPVPADGKERKISGLEIIHLKEEYLKIRDNMERNGWVKRKRKENGTFSESLDGFCMSFEMLLSVYLNENTTLRVFENTEEEKTYEINDIFNNLILKFKIADLSKTFELENVTETESGKINFCIEQMEKCLNKIKELAGNDEDTDDSFIRKLENLLKDVSSYKDNKVSIISEDMKNGLASAVINPVYLKQNYYREEDIFKNDTESMKKFLGRKEFKKYFFELSEDDFLTDSVFRQMRNYYIENLMEKTCPLNSDDITIFGYASRLRKKAYQIPYGVTRESVITLHDINPEKTGALTLAFNIKPVNYSKSFHLYSAYYIFYH